MYTRTLSTISSSSQNEQKEESTNHANDRSSTQKRKTTPLELMAMKALSVGKQTSSLQATRSNAAQVASETTGIDTSDVNRNRDALEVS